MVGGPLAAGKLPSRAILGSHVCAQMSLSLEEPLSWQERVPAW